MQYDIIIIGGGMVGGSLACALRHTSLRIALVDAAPLHTQDDPRLIALNYSSYCLLNNIGIWEALNSHATAIKQVHVSDRGHFGITRINASDVNLSALGYVVPAKYINAAIDNNLEGISLFRPAKLKTLIQSEQGATLRIETENGEIELSTQLVIGADGSYSTVREQLGIPSDTIDYHQSALVTITELKRSHNNIAYERFHAAGAIAMLPLTEQRSATIWTDKTDVIEHLLQLNDADFLAELQKQFGYRAGRLLRIGKRHVFPLKMLSTTQMRQQHVILIGNAAHTLNPIAAQGLNLALAEIAMLAEIIQDNPTNINWQSYIEWQQKQQATSTQLSHQLPLAFSSDFSLLNFVRQIGMIGLDICPPMKRGFTRRALGRTAHTPKLLLNKCLKKQ
jgi:2-octaprenyl-6-methoxyphenol hydroxylase